MGPLYPEVLNGKTRFITREGRTKKYLHVLFAQREHHEFQFSRARAVNGNYLLLTPENIIPVRDPAKPINSIKRPGHRRTEAAFIVARELARKIKGVPTKERIAWEMKILPTRGEWDAEKDAEHGTNQQPEIDGMDTLDFTSSNASVSLTVDAIRKLKWSKDLTEVYCWLVGRKFAKGSRCPDMATQEGDDADTGAAATGNCSAAEDHGEVAAELENAALAEEWTEGHPGEDPEDNPYLHPPEIEGDDTEELD